MDKYIFQFGQIHLAIWTNTFCTKDKCILKCGQIHYEMGFMPPSRQLGTVVHCIQLTELHPNSLQQFLQLILQYCLNVDFHPFRFLTLTPLIFVESHTHSLHLCTHLMDFAMDFGLLSWILLLFVKWINPITYWMYKHVTLCLFLKTVFSVTRRSRSDESCRVTCWVGQRLHWL